MKTDKPTVEEKLPKGFRINPSLDDRNYDEHPYFKEKLDRANEILRKHPIPKELLEQHKK